MQRPAGTAQPQEPPALNQLDSDLWIKVTGHQCSTFSKDGFCYMFGGVRSSIGVVKGRWCFHVKFVAVNNVNVLDTKHLKTSYIARVGVSQLHTPVGQLGEATAGKYPAGTSVGLNSSGSRVNAGFFSQMLDPSKGNQAWPAFRPGDTLTVFVDLSPGRPTGRLGFALNETMLGFIPDPITQPEQQLKAAGKDQQQQQMQAVALFPHLLLRNCTLELDLTSPPMGKLGNVGLDDGGPYQPWQQALSLATHGCVAPDYPPPDKSQCEVLMMVGLPGSGKTTWAMQWSAQHPDKRYMLLSPQQVLDAMRVLRLTHAGVKKRLAEPSQQKQQSQSATTVAFEQDNSIEQYYGLANSTFIQLCLRAVNVQRNYIMDQTNVSEASRVAKLAPFRKAGFSCRAALAAPYLAYLAMLQETAQSEGAPHVPDDIVMSLMAEFVAPRVGGPEGFTEVLLVHAPSKRTRDAPDNNDDKEPQAAKVARVARRVVAPQQQLAQQRLRAGK